MTSNAEGKEGTIGLLGCSFFTPSTDDVNCSTSSNDGLSEEAEVPATRTAVSTKWGGESKDGNTVVADTGMKESQSKKDDISDLESSRKPDSPELPKGVEESFDDWEEKEKKTQPQKRSCGDQVQLGLGLQQM